MAHPKAWPIQFRHPDDQKSRKARYRCVLKAKIWNVWTFIGTMATEAQIAQLLRVPRRTARWGMALLKQQGFVRNVHKHGLLGAMEVEFRIESCRTSTRESCRVKSSLLSYGKKREKASSEPRSADDLKNSFLAKCEDPEGIIAAICEIALLRKAKNGGDTPKSENWFLTCVRAFNWNPGSQDREDYQQYVHGRYAP